MALISDIAHCNGVISKCGGDKGVRWNVFKYQPPGPADVPKKPTQYSHIIARSLYYGGDTVSCQNWLKIFTFPRPCPLTRDFSSTPSSLPLFILISLSFPLLSNVAFSLLVLLLFHFFPLFVSLTIQSNCSSFHSAISCAVIMLLLNIEC